VQHGPTAGKIGTPRIKRLSTTKLPSTAIQTIILNIGRNQSTTALKTIITVIGLTIEQIITITGFIVGIIRITDTNTGTGPIIKSTMMIIDRL
jgi:hypothetical protein